MKLKTFGIEIRRIGNVDALYDDVDSVLRAAGIADPGGVSAQVQRNAVVHALHVMMSNNGAFNSKHFSVCTVRACAEACGVVISQERMAIYSTAHCMDWSAMLPEFRQQLCAMVLDDFRGVITAQP